MRSSIVRVVLVTLLSVFFAAHVAAQADLAARVEALVQDVPRLSAARPDLPLDPALAADMGFISALAVDEKTGLFFLLQRGAKLDPVVVVDRQGKLVRSWGKGLFQTPHSIRLDSEGHVWTVDSMSSHVLKFSSDGDLLMTIAVGNQPDPTKVSGTADVAFGPDGQIFIADGYGNARILEYDAQGRKVREWGTSGTGPGQFNVPHAVIRDGDVLYVADRENGRVQMFDLSGMFLAQWDGLVKPMSLARASDGGIVVAIGYRNAQGQAPPWLAWVVKLDPQSGRLTGALEVGDDAHGMALIEGAVLTGGTAGPNAAVHQFSFP